mgnify:CR=1 FL=1
MISFVKASSSTKGENASLNLTGETSVDPSSANTHTFVSNAKVHIQSSTARNPRTQSNPIFSSHLSTLINLGKSRKRIFPISYVTHAHSYIKQGFSDGFCLGCQGSPSRNTSQNHKSCAQYPEIIYSFIQEGLQKGRLAGPLK